MATTRDNSLAWDLGWFALRGSDADIERAKVMLRKAIGGIHDEDVPVTRVASGVSEIRYQQWGRRLSREGLRGLLTELPDLKLKGIAQGRHVYEEVYSRAGSPDWVSVEFLKDYPSDDLPTYRWWDKDDFFELARNMDGTLRIAGFHRWDTEVEIPSEIDGVAVTGIGDRTFYRNTHIKKLVIPESVTSIGKSAFSGCSNLVVYTTNQHVLQALEKAKVSVMTGLESEEDIGAKASFLYHKDKNGIVITKYRGSAIEVAIPEVIEGQPVIGIGKGAFDRGPSNPLQITTVSIPASVASIGPHAFRCPRLSRVEFAPSSSLESIGDGAFSGCHIDKLVLPDGLKEIGERAFYDCGPLKAIRIPACVESIGIQAFGGSGDDAWPRDSYLGGRGWRQKPATFCLERIDVDDENRHFVSSDGALLSKDFKRLIRVPVFATGTYVVPDGVIDIGASAFEGCHIEGVTIPASVRMVGSNAFSHCHELKEVTFAEESVLEEVGERAFSYCKRLKGCEYPAGVQRVAAGTFSGCEQLNTFSIPSEARSVDSDAFGGCDSLNEISVEPGSKLESIAEHAFDGCKSLESVDLSAAEGLTGVAELAFLGGFGAYALRYVKFPASLSKFEKWFGDDAPSHTEGRGVDFFAPGLACSAIKPRNYKMNGAAGFVRGMMEGGNASPQITRGYRTYVNGHAEELLERFEFDRNVLKLLLEQKWLTASSANNLAQAMAEKGLTEQAAMVLEYCSSVGNKESSSNDLSLEERPRRRVTKKSAPENVEPLVAEWLKKVRVIPECKRAITSGVRLANGEGKCSPEAVQLLVSLCYIPRSVARDPFQEWDYLEYLEPPEYWEKNGWGRRLGNGTNEFTGSLFNKLTKLSGTASAISEIASWLDSESLSETLERTFYEDNLASVLVALCRFGNESAIKRVTSDMPKWKASTTLRKDYYIAECVLLHSRTVAAMRHYDSEGLLHSYAGIHGTTQGALRGKYLS